MAYDKVIDSQWLENFLTDCANRIRKKASPPYNTKKYSAQAQDFQNAIDSIPTGSGSENNNCEAYVITLPDYELNFKNTGKIKLWGYGEDGSGYQKTGYAFAGTVYHRTGLGGGQSSINVTLNPQGKLDGLPSMTSATLLVTVGI